MEKICRLRSKVRNSAIATLLTLVDIIILILIEKTKKNPNFGSTLRFVGLLVAGAALYTKKTFLLVINLVVSVPDSFQHKPFNFCLWVPFLCSPTVKFLKSLKTTRLV